MVCKELGLSDKTLRNWVKAVGWTAPYLDLLGARMMITASYPIHASEPRNLSWRRAKLRKCWQAMGLTLIDGVT